MTTPGTPDLIVTLVHGTFPRGMPAQVAREIRALWQRLSGSVDPSRAGWRAGAPTAWFERHSSFATGIVSAIPDAAVRIETFYWTGRNRFRDRQQAADRLRAFLARLATECPHVPQVVVAHSHGGTVATDALGDRDHLPPREIVRIVTLATPFIRLAEWHDDDASPTNVAQRLTVQGRHVIGFLLPPLLLASCVVIPAGVLLTKAGSPGVAIVALLVAAVMTVGGRVALAMLLVPVLVGWAWPVVTSHIVELVFAAILLAFGLMGAIASRVNSQLHAVVRRGPLHLPCPLLALRSPRDEASLAIGLGQLAQAAVHTLGRMRDFRRSAGADGGSLATAAAPAAVTGGWRAPAAVVRAGEHLAWTAGAVLAGLIVGSVVLAAAAWLGWGTYPVAWGVPALHAVIALGLRAAAGLMVLLIAPPIVVGFAWLVVTALLAMVAGPEVTLRPAVTYVDTEPLPHARGADGMTDAELRLEILYDATSPGLRHSLYEDPLARSRVGRELAEVIARARVRERR